MAWTLSVTVWPGEINGNVAIMETPAPIGPTALLISMSALGFVPGGAVIVNWAVVVVPGVKVTDVGLTVIWKGAAAVIVNEYVAVWFSDPLIPRTVMEVVPVGTDNGMFAITIRVCPRLTDCPVEGKTVTPAASPSKEIATVPLKPAMGVMEMDMPAPIPPCWTLGNPVAESTKSGVGGGGGGGGGDEDPPPPPHPMPTPTKIRTEKKTNRRCIITIQSIRWDLNSP